MRKNRTLRWLFVGVVAVVGLGYLALATRISPDPERYDVAVGYLRAEFAGPKVFTVTPLDDPRTRLSHFDTYFVLQGVMKTDHPDLAVNTKNSPTGEIPFQIEVWVSRRLGGLSVTYSPIRYHFEPVK